MFDKYLILFVIAVLLPVTTAVTFNQVEGVEIIPAFSSANGRSSAVSLIDEESSPLKGEMGVLDSSTTEPETTTTVQSEEEVKVEVHNLASWMGSIKEPTLGELDAAQLEVIQEEFDNSLSRGGWKEMQDQDAILWDEPVVAGTCGKMGTPEIAAKNGELLGVCADQGKEMVFLHNNAERGKIESPVGVTVLAKKLEFASESDPESIGVPEYYIPDIPLVRNERVESFIKMYTHRKRDVLKRAIARSPKYMKMIHRIFKEHGLPLNLAYLAVVESNFNPIARSRVRATGLWQFMGYTGKIFGLHRSWWHDDRIDPERATIAAAKYLKQLYKQFKGDWELALAAYNSGGGRVKRELRRARRRGKPQNFWALKLPRETRGYVPAFYAVATIFSDLRAYGFEPAPEPEEEVVKQAANVPGGVSLKQVAIVLKTDHNILVKLNPRLTRGITPAIYKKFEIAIPPHLTLGSSEYRKLTRERRQFWKFHRVRKGESLWSLSRRFQIPISKIKSFNQMRRNLLRIGQKIMLPLPSDWTPKRYVKNPRPRKALSVSGLNYVHVVVQGETLWSIANRFNLSMKNIKRWNRKVLRSRFLRVGTPLRLKLPVKVTLAI